MAMLKGMRGPHLQTDKWKGELDNLVQNSTTVDEQVKHLTEALSEKATAAQALSDQVKEVSVFLKEHHSICPCSTQIKEAQIGSMASRRAGFEAAPCTLVGG
jgi:hypothetical protein